MLTALGTRRARVLGSALAIAMLTTGCLASAGAPGHDAPPGGINGQIFHLTNAERSARGLPALQWSNQLGGLANEWSRHMGSTGNFAHRNLNQVLSQPAYSGYSRLGENILVGACGMSATDIKNAWMNSSGHRANILGSYNVTGVGVVCMNGRLWATQNFGLR